MSFSLRILILLLAIPLLYHNKGIAQVGLDLKADDIKWKPTKPKTTNDFLNALLFEVRNPEKDHFITQILAIANHYVKAGNFDHALYWFHLALSYSEVGDPKQQEIYRALVPLMTAKGNFEEALHFHHLALANTKDSLTTAHQSLWLVQMFVFLGDYNKAFQYVEQADLFSRQKGDLYFLATSIGEKAIVFKGMKDFKKMVNESLRALDIANKIPIGTAYSNRQMAPVLSLRNRLTLNVGDGYLSRNLADSALFYFKKVDTSPIMIDSITKAIYYVNIGQAFIMKKQYDLGNLYLNHGKSLIKQSGNRLVEMELAGELSNIYSVSGNYEKAWDYHKEYLSLKDSFSSIATIHRINALESKYNLAQKDRELDRKELMILRQASRLQARTWLVGCLVLVLGFVFIILALSRRGNRNKQRLLQEKLNSADRERRMIQIEASMKGEEKERTRIAKELHDGVVSEVLALKLNLKAMEQECKELKYISPYRNALQQSEEIAMKLRQTAHNLMPIELKEKGLYLSIDAFLRRINSRNIKFTFQHYDQLPPFNPEVEKIIFLMILELIQNVIKHSKATEAIIQLSYFENILSITVEDNGVGMPAGLDEHKSGMGLANIRENINLLQATLDIQSSEYTGTTILVEIPIPTVTEEKILA